MKGGLPLTVALLVAAIGCSRGDGEEPPPPTEGAAAPQAEPSTPPLVTGGRVESEREALVLGSGRVLAVHVREGDRVSRGDLLVELAGDAAVSDYEDAARLSSEAAALAAEAALAGMERAEALFEAGAISARALDAARSSAAAAVGELDMAEAELGEASAMRSAATVTAPFDGVVGRIRAREGETAEGPLVLVVGEGRLLVRAMLPEMALGQVRPGDVATFTPDAQGVTGAAGTVTSVASAVDPVTGLVPVTVTLEEGSDIPSGTPGRLTLARRGAGRH